MQQALKLFEKVVIIKLLALPETHVHIIKARQHVSEILQRLGRYDESFVTREKVLAAQTETSGKLSADVAETKLELAKTSELQKKYGHSLALFRESLELFQANTSSASQKRTTINTGLVSSAKDAEEAIPRVLALVEAADRECTITLEFQATGLDARDPNGMSDPRTGQAKKKKTKKKKKDAELHKTEATKAEHNPSWKPE